MPYVLGALALAVGASVNITRADGWAVMGAVAGTMLFIRGFMMLRFKRLIINTPASKVRSASMGLVEISGLAKGPSTIPAGVTGEACYYYRAIVWQLKQSGKDQQWQKVADESFYVPFFVEDSTGRMLIDPQGADLDIHPNFKDEFDTSFFSSSRNMLPENVARLMARNGVAFDHNTRIEEYCIKPDYSLFVLGTLGDNPDRLSWTPGAHIPAVTSLHSHFNMLGFGGGTFHSLSASSGFNITFSKARVPISFVPAASSGTRSVSPAPAPAASVWSEVSMDEVALGRKPSAAQPAAAQTTSASVATADPEPITANATDGASASSGFDLRAPVCISCGTNKDPFMISWRSQREVVQSLAWKSALCIWGGPSLTLGCLYYLAFTLGWT